MKKYLKLQAKKSLSLLMAVLMLMTCWVWIAPEKAEAANSPDEGYYYVEVRGKLDDYASSNETATNEWIIKHANGQDTLTSGDIYNNGANDMSVNHVHAYGWVRGFPTGITHNFKRAVDGCGDAVGNGFGVRGATLWVGSGPDNLVQVTNDQPDTGYTAQDGTYNDSQIIAAFKDGASPEAGSFKTTSGKVEKYEVEVPAIGSLETKTVNGPTAGVYDQYGVRIKAADTYYVSTSETGNPECVKDSNDDYYIGAWSEGTKVTINATVQIKHSSASGSNKIYLIASADSAKAAIAEITLKYPSYTVKVDPNGSITNLGAVMDMSDNSTRTEPWSFSGSYNTSAQTYPKDTASKEGYTFKGFWTTKQPTTGDAGTNASEANFANPTDSTTFDTYKAQEDSVLSENNLVVTLADGSKYYNAGTQWDPSTSRTITGAATYYGWWVPKDITVKFYDIDGTYLGTKTTKYGKVEAENWYPDPKDSYNAGAFEYNTFAYQWRDITGAVITEGTYKFGPLESLSLTPIYTDKTYSDKYDITFVDPSEGNVTKEYDYRYILKGDDIPTVDVPGAIVYDSGYTYEFSGWTSQKPAKGNYHTVEKDDTSFVENTDWVVRDDITYYAVFRSTVKEYVIAFTYTDSTGTEKTDIKYIPYGSAITTPTNVNRTYAKGGYGYTLEGWDYVNNDSETVMLGVDATLVFNDENVFLTGENLKDATPEKPIVFKANYDEGQPTPYTVTFKYKDAKGADKTVTAQVYHGYNIDAETVEKLVVPAQYDDGTALYTFANKWIVTEGTADKAEYTADEFTSFSPTSHVTFEAVYGEGVPFYTVTYIDGANTYSERILAGSNVPAWMVGEGEDAKEYAPVKAKTETGEYTFEGWFDAEQTDKNFAQTNGTEYTTADTVNGDLVLYSQFTFSPFKFKIVFKNYDGTVLAEGDYIKGAEFKDIYDEAMAAAVRADDDTYSYRFIGWDYKVPNNFCCEGKDMTYTALYQPSYRYYQAYWYKNNTLTDLVATTNHTFDGAVYAPSVDLEIPADKTFAGWYYENDDGKEIAYQRGMTIIPGMKFYAKYEDATVTYTVTAVINDEEVEYKVNAGEKLPVLSDPASGWVDADKHNKFAGWFTEATGGEEFDFDTVINADTTIYAQFTEEEHDMAQKELISSPTYYAKGSEKVWCECSREKTEEIVEIPMLTDTVAPTGTIYLGTQGSWSSTDEIGAAATDNDEVTLFVNADTDIILTINDTGDVNETFNPDGKGKGIKTIRGIISTGVFGEGTTEAQMVGIQTIFSDESETLNNTANYVIRLGSYEGLVDGETYIAYYYAADKAGNALNKNVRTAKFIYDITAPEIIIEGDSNAATATSTVTYCGKATAAIEEGATVTVNGKEVTVTDGKYVITEAGNYIITVTDRAGNTASKKIIVVGGHDEVTTSKAVTCTEDGYEKVICALCGKVIKNETIKSEGHKYGEVETINPTCTEGGYKVKTCSVCGDEVKTDETPAAGHTYDKDADDNIIYVTVTASTCKVKGKAEAVCNVCGEGKLEKELDLDTVDGHNYGATKILKATCTADGEEYAHCKYCYQKTTIKVLDKLNHEDTGRVTKITTEPTCTVEGVETTCCKACGEELSTAPVAVIAHTLVLKKYEGEQVLDGVTYKDGYMRYECAVCDYATDAEPIVVKKTYTVTFKGAGAEGADVVITKTEGESIVANTVADQTKAEDNEYTYTFAGWKGTDGKVVKLPVKVTKNETYTAEFTATKRTYTHVFTTPDLTKSTYATFVGYYGDTNKKPATNPTKPATTTETYEFAGWYNAADLTQTTVEDFTMTGDATFVAKFTAVPVNFNVIFYNEDGSYIWSTEGNTTSEAVKYNKVVDGNLVIPAKAPDADGHYTFAGWKLGDDTFAIDYNFAPITGKITPKATYTAAAHTFEEVKDAAKTWDATCTKAGQKTEKCSVCDFEKVTAIPMIDHDYELQEDGSQKCSGCGAVIEAEVQEFNITFAENITYYDVEGEEVTETENAINTSEKTKKYTEDADVVYTAATKADTAKYTVEFIGWTVNDGTEIAFVDAELKVKAEADVTYTANYKATWRTYKVIYLDAERKTIDGAEFDVAYGATVPEIDAEPEKAYTDDDHYTFNGWSVEAGTVVTKEYQIVPLYKAESHDMVKQPAVEGEKDCEKEGVDTYKCECGITKTVGTATKKHRFTVEEKAATYDEAGYINKTCKECGKVVNMVVPKLELKTLKVKVVKDGTFVADAKVTIYTATEEWPAKATGMSTGIVEFTDLKHGTYTILVTKDGTSAQKDVVIGADETVKEVIVDMTADSNSGSGNDNGGSNAPSCSCSCHRPGFWGIIFRFFHKIISFFTGRVNCCADPQTI